MIDETRDPELESIRAHWEPQPPGVAFDERVLSAYRREFGGMQFWRRWLTIRVPLPVTAAVALGAFLLALSLAPRLHPWSSRPHPIGIPAAVAPAAAGRYQPVRQPHLIVISQGERP